MNVNGCVALLGLAIFFRGAAAEEAPGASPPPISLADELRSPDMEVRADAWGRVRSAREMTIGALQVVARAKEEDQWTKRLRSRAIEMLGQYRVVAAVDVLIGQIEAPPGHGFLNGIQPVYEFPTIQAILRVGEPAIREILAVRTAKAMTEREVKLFSYVIWMYYAPLEEQEVGLFRMERLLARERQKRAQAAEKTGKARDPSVREKNLAQLVEVYKAIGPHGPRDWPKQRYSMDVK